MDDINKDPYICKCAACMKLGPLYSSMNKNNKLLTPECTIIKEEFNNINKKRILNIVWVFILLFLLISSKFKYV
tara:strand:+ start:273 stop:494 length:222 start_codon:yes stop_codon:yes gene_type:complete